MPADLLEIWKPAVAQHRATVGLLVSGDLTSTFAKAAAGDVRAQAAVLDHMVLTALQPGALSPDSLAAIELWARMLAANSPSDGACRLAGVLLFKGSICRLSHQREVSEPMIEEGFGYLHRLAAEGDPTASAQAAELSRRLAKGQSIPAEVMLGDLAPTSH